MKHLYMLNEILDMIEKADSKDTKKLDEIDARVWCFLNNVELHQHPKIVSLLPFEDKKEAMSDLFIYKKYGVEKTERIIEYTRSRDALKSIRPEGYSIELCSWKDGIWCVLRRRRPFKVGNSPCLPTEELAELYVVLKSIDYESRK